jgi:hypothetical protein
MEANHSKYGEYKMAKYNMPYRFNVDGVGFDVTFRIIETKLEYGESPNFQMTLAFARKVNTTETLVTKSIFNRRDKWDYQQGQRQAFKRLLERVWVNWYWTNNLIALGTWVGIKNFVQHARDYAYMAGMWNTDKE